MSLRRQNSLVVALALLEWILFLFLDVRPDFVVLGVTYAMCLLAGPSWIVFPLQAPLLFITPHGGARALLFTLAFLGVQRFRSMSYRYALLLLTAMFAVLARFDGFSLPVMFPGVMAGAAVVYAVSRVRGVGVRLAPVLTAYVGAIIPYILLSLYLEAGFHARPVIVIPLDIIQLVTVAVLFQSLQKEGTTGSEASAEGSAESPDATGTVGGDLPAEP